MNERFFDLKKDRQDRIINGAMRIFTENGFRHASTDEMVAAASISKGLLFHYFKSKKGAYLFLYEYCTRYMLIEMREAERRRGCDYFEMQRLLSLADTAVLRKYPCLPVFLHRADSEASLFSEDKDMELPEGIKEACAALRRELLASSSLSPFLTGDNMENLSRILSYTRYGLMHELLARQELPADAQADHPALPLHEEYAQRFQSYLQMLRRMNL